MAGNVSSLEEGTRPDPTVAAPRAPGVRATLAHHWPIVALLTFGLFVALWLGNDYGVSWDEVRNADVGRDALGLLSGSREYFSNESLADHGPVYFAFFSATSQGISRMLAGWTEADGRHLTNFLAFLAAVLCFYSLALRWLGRTYAWMAAALFATQPLFFGYAFVNQKDIPFLTLFMATMVTGLAAADRLKRGPREVAPEPVPDQRNSSRWDSLKSEWVRLPRTRRAILSIALAVGAVLTIDLLFAGVLHGVGRSVVESAYRGEATALVQRLFDRIAVDAYKTPIAAYLDKYEAFFLNLRWTLVAALALASLILVGRSLPSAGDAWGLDGRRSLPASLLASAIFLGLTICIRQVGAFAGLLVSLLILWRLHLRAVFPLAVYWIVAAVTTYLTWPYLWPDPLGRLAESLRLAADFSSHRTLFQGRPVFTGALPWNFFPTLTALQLTEPIVVLMVVGLVVGAGALLRRVPEGGFILILALWVLVPLIVLIVFRTAGYEFRHFLFMLPPLLIIAGAGLEAAARSVRWKPAPAVLFTAAMMPGLIGILQLHPYEYIYYNGFAGGVGGADGLYQLDRECLSYREAIEVVNGFASPAALVVVPQQVNQVTPFARPDLIIRDATVGIENADIVLSCTWRDSGDWRTGGFSLVYEVKRSTAVLTQVWTRADTP